MSGAVCAAKAPVKVKFNKIEHVVYKAGSKIKSWAQSYTKNPSNTAGNYMISSTVMDRSHLNRLEPGS